MSPDAEPEVARALVRDNCTDRVATAHLDIHFRRDRPLDDLRHGAAHDIAGAGFGVVQCRITSSVYFANYLPWPLLVFFHCDAQPINSGSIGFGRDYQVVEVGKLAVVR